MSQNKLKATPMPVKDVFWRRSWWLLALLVAEVGLLAAAAAAPGELAQAPLTCTPVTSAVAASPDDGILFQAEMDRSDWSGDLKALDADTLNPVWSASAAEQLRAAPASSRVVLTLGAGDGVALTAESWDGLATAQRDDLRTNRDGTRGSEDAGKRRLAHLRGDRGCEDPTGCRVDVNDDGDSDDPEDVLTLRRRASLLGDIVNGGPVVVGAPQLYWPAGRPGGLDYPEFKARERPPVVYVGANDGMLHGFDASRGGGAELVAYVPAALSSSEPGLGLHYLAERDYAHRYYVDRAPAVSDVYIDSTGGGVTAWRTAAVGGLGAGGRGLYALDVTDPARFAPDRAADLVMWELSGVEEPDLGYSLSQPVIALMNNGRWAAIVGNGYQDLGEARQAQLFVIFLEGGLDGAWTEGADYIKIPATLAGLTESNGLSSPTVADLDADGTADRIYAGDPLGNLWAFDLESSSTNDWGVAGSGTPLFRAGASQPISIKPEIAKHPSVEDSTANGPNLMVYFGTGQYLTAADEGTTATQSFYGVWDRGDQDLTRTRLQQQSFLAGFGDQVLSDLAVEWDGADQDGDGATEGYGWRLDLPVAGERVVVAAALRGGILFFNTLVPGGCSGFLYAVDMENGGSPDAPAFDRNGDWRLDAGDLVSRASDPAEAKVASRAAFAGTPTASRFVGDVRYTGGSREGGGVHKEAAIEIKGLYSGRWSWQQLDSD